MDKDVSYAESVLSLLKERNMKENSFGEIIIYSNKLLESLDYLKKENASRKLDSAKTETIEACKESSKSEEISMLVKGCTLQKDLAECHKKISEYAQQIIVFRNQLDEKDKIITLQKQELQESQNSLKKYQELYQNYCKQIETLKTTLQNKIDECDTLNITYSSLENKKNNLEIENKILKNEITAYKNKKQSPLARESHGMSMSSSGDSIDKTLRRQSTPELSKQLSITKVKSNDNITRVKSNENITKEISNDNISKVKSSDKCSSNISHTVIPKNVKYNFDAHNNEVNCVLWVPASSQLITAGADRKVKIWDMTDGAVELKKTVKECNSSITSVDLDIEAGLLLCSSCDFASRIWTVCDFTLRHTLTGHSGKVMSTKFLPSESQIVSGSTDQTLKLWDLRRRACVQTCNTGSSVNDLICKSSHVVISCHANGKINFWDTRTNSLSKHLLCSGGVTSLDISQNGYLLLASQLDNRLALYDIRKYKEICSFFGNGFEIAFDWTRAKFSPDNQYCCCGSKNGCIFVWNVRTGALDSELLAHIAPVVACNWSSCGSYLASCDSKKKCIIWSNS